MRHGLGIDPHRAELQIMQTAFKSVIYFALVPDFILINQRKLDYFPGDINLSGQ